MKNSNVLTLGRGKNKRQWELTDEEFARFEAMFEESELIDTSDIDLSSFKLTLVDPPVRKAR